MLTAYVLLTLTVWDADTGVKLYETERPMWSREQNENLIERCRLIGVNRAHRLVAQYRGDGHPNSFANVDCEWHRGEPT